MKSSLVWMAILNVAMYFASADEMNEIQIFPDNAKSTEMGGDLVMTCTYAEEVIENVRWLDPEGTEVVTTPKRTLEVEDSSLLLTLVGVSYNDEGLYTCEGLNKVNNETIRMTREVGVFEPLQFVDTEEVQVFEIGTMATIVCNVVGNPPPSIYWLRGTDKISALGEKYTIIDPGYLIITNISKDDEGEYVCKARERMNGQAIKRTIEVNVNIPPEIVDFQSELISVEGHPAILTCEATGEPTPMFSWHRGGSTTADGSTVVVNGSTLSWDKVMKSDEGEYTCVAYNEVTNVSKTATLIVYVKPYFTVATGDSTTQGEKAFIECVAEGDPTPQMVIFKDGLPMEEMGNSSVEEDLFGNDTSNSPTTGAWSSNRVTEYNENRASISFLYTEPSDAGEYQCQAESDAGIKSQMVMLTVKYAPRDTKLKSRHTCPSQAPTLECDFDGNPTPEMAWGQMVTPEGTLEDGDNSTFHAYNASNPPAGILIEDVNGILALTIDVSEANDPYKTYYCRAENEIGINIEDAELLQATAPESPLDVTVTDVSTRQATITFTEPMYSSVPNDYYIIQLFPTDSSLDTEKINLDASSTEYTFTELEHDTEYRVVIETKNCKDTSPPSEIITFTTKAIVLPDALDILSGESSEDHDKFTIKWSLNSLGGGEISKISFVIRKESIANSSSVFIEFDDFEITPGDVEFQNQSVTLEDLDPGSRYEISVNVHNEVGMAETKHLFITATKPQTTTPSTTTDENQIAAGSIDLMLIIIIVAVLLLLLIIIDLVCFFTRSWGCTMWVYMHTCGKSKGKKIQDAEEGSAEFRNNEHEGKFRSKLTPISEQTPLSTEEPAGVPQASGNGTKDGAIALAVDEGDVRNEKETPSQPQEEEKKNLVKSTDEAEEKDA